MAQSFKATADVRCRKTHTCVGCGGEFSYVLARTVTAEGASEGGAAENARVAATKAAEQSVDVHPCPHCGVVQPEMVAETQQPIFVGALCVAVCGALFGLFTGLAQGFSIHIAAQISAAAMVAAWLVATWGAAHNPNRSPESNLGDVVQRVERGKLFPGEPPPPPEGGPDIEKQVKKPLLRASTGARQLGLGLAMAAIPIAAAPVLMATAKGWYVNETCWPSVAGPGDKTRFYFKEKITSLKGMWQGFADGAVTNAEELGVAAKIPLVCKTNSSTWGERITGKSVSNETRQMWCDVTFPRVPELAGKTVDLFLEVKATFPLAVGNAQFDDREASFMHNTSLAMAEAGAGEMYFKAFVGGQLVAILAAVMSFLAFWGGCNDLRAARSKTVLESADPPEE